MSNKTPKYHYVKILASDRSGRAHRTDAPAKRYHLTFCGREITDIQAREQFDLPYDCATCVKLAA